MTKKEITNEKIENEETVKIEQPITEVAPEEPKETIKNEKSVEELADEVERGVHGSGRERMLVLGDRYEEVQSEVNLRFRKASK